MFDFSHLFRTLASAASIFVFLAPVARLAAQSSSGDELNKGVEAYRAARYPEAISHFQKATDLDPSSHIAKTYLGTALAQSVIPGLDTPENLKTAQYSIAVFQQALEQEPHDVNSMKQVASVYFAVRDLDNAKTWEKKVLNEDPRASEAAYTVGVIDWELAHLNALRAFAPLGLQDDGMGNSKAPADVLETLRIQNGPLVEEALEYLQQAIENRPNYDDAMAYLNLVYRRKADVDFADEAARKDDVDNAEKWRRKSMEARKANEEKKLAGSDSAQP